MKKLLLGVVAACLAEIALAASSPQDVSALPYFGNSVVLRNTAGEIFEILIFKPDRTYRVWQGGVWHDATWLTNNGQDSKIMCLTHGNPVKTYCHPMTLNKKIGEKWRAGQPLMLNGKWTVADAPETVAASGSLYWTGLEAGTVSPPDHVLPQGPPPPSVDMGPPRDKIVEPYLGNSVVLRDKAGAIVEIDNYNADHTLRQWRVGTTPHWKMLHWLTNNGHDGTLLCLTADQDGTPVTNCFYVPVPRKLGETWEPQAPNTAAKSGLTGSLEKGLVSPPTL